MVKATPRSVPKSF